MFGRKMAPAAHLDVKRAVIMKALGNLKGNSGSRMAINYNYNHCLLLYLLYVLRTTRYHWPNAIHNKQQAGARREGIHYLILREKALNPQPCTR